MESLYVYLILAAIILIQIIGLIILWLQGKKQKDALVFDKRFELLQGEVGNLSRVLDNRIDQSTSRMNESVRTQLESSQSLIRDITRRIAEVQESNKQVFGFGEELKNLQKVLTHQKQRGALGERGLEIILQNILGPDGVVFTPQHRFENGEIVDVAITVDEGIIPIDAKFSLDNYNRWQTEENESAKTDLERQFKNDLKKRIDETAKYIRPAEGTLDFALMYIPAEGIYYDLVVNTIGSNTVTARNMLDYAHEKKVIIVSPNTLVAYLHTIVHGFKAFQFEKKTEEIQKRVGQLQKHLEVYVDLQRKVGENLTKAVSAHNKSSKEFGKIATDTRRITGEETVGVEITEVTVPVTED